MLMSGEPEGPRVYIHQLAIIDIGCVMNAIGRNLPHGWTSEKSVIWAFPLVSCACVVIGDRWNIHSLFDQLAT